MTNSKQALRPDTIYLFMIGLKHSELVAQTANHVHLPSNQE
jgi:hypothetical protein